MGREACGETSAEQATTTYFRWFGSLREASASVTANDHAAMATSMSNDPLVVDGEEVRVEYIE